MFPQRSAFVWASLCRVFTACVWTRGVCSASAAQAGKVDLETFRYDDDYIMISEQDLRGALGNCVAGDHP